MTRAELIRARKEALESGAITYQGAPCAHGHSGIRYTANRLCVSCAKARRKRQTNQPKGKQT